MTGREPPLSSEGAPLFDALLETAAVLTELGETPGLPLLEVAQSIDFARALFDDLSEIVRLRDLLHRPELVVTALEMEEALRTIRVAALAVQQRGAAAIDKALPRLATAKAELEEATTGFLGAFRTFIEGAPDEVQRRALAVLDRYGEQLEARQLVAEVRETRDEAKRVLGQTQRVAEVAGEGSLALHFGTFAHGERRVANLLRGACIAVIFAITAIAAFLVLHKDKADLTTARELAKLAITIPLAALATYLAREASRHRGTSRRARELEIQLQTVGAFTAGLPDTLRDQIRTELGKRVFATVYEGESEEGEAGPSVAADATGLLEQIVDLLKAAAAVRSGS